MMSTHLVIPPIYNSLTLFCDVVGFYFFFFFDCPQGEQETTLDYEHIPLVQRPFIVMAFSIRTLPARTRPKDLVRERLVVLQYLIPCSMIFRID